MTFWLVYAWSSDRATVFKLQRGRFVCPSRRPQHIPTVEINKCDFYLFPQPNDKLFSKDVIGIASHPTGSHLYLPDKHTQCFHILYPNKVSPLFFPRNCLSGQPHTGPSMAEIQKSGVPSILPTLSSSGKNPSRPLASGGLWLLVMGLFCSWCTLQEPPRLTV